MTGLDSLDSRIIWPAPSDPKPSPAHILVVDDEPEIAESLADFLIRKEGFKVSLAEDGQTAIDILREALEEGASVDLVLLDMLMPNLSGADVLAWIRQHQELQYTRVVLLTAVAGNTEKVEVLSAGADDYITKPYYPQELLARVKTILRTQQLEKQLQAQSQQLAALNRIGREVAATLEVPAIFSLAADRIDSILGIEVTAVFMLVEDNHLRCQHLYHDQTVLTTAAFPDVPTNDGVLGLAYKQETAVILNDPLTQREFSSRLDQPQGLKTRNMMVTPLLVRGRSVGVLAAYNKKTGNFSEFDLDLFKSLAQSISAGIQNAWLFQRIRLRQRELLESRNTLQALIDGIPHPIYTINDDWRLVSINRSKLDELDQQLDPEKLTDLLVGQICYRTFFKRETPCEHCQVASTLNDKEAQRWSYQLEGEDLLPQEWDINAYPVPGKEASSASAVIVWQDRTEERRLESSLIQAGKLAAIGQLAAGVAHEINNPLTAINANAELLKFVIPRNDENYESVELITKAGERAARVVRGLLDFARQEQYQVTEGNLNQSIEESLELVRYQLQSANITVTKKMADDIPKIFANWERLKSVWLNLIVNAIDALVEFEDERHLEVTTRLVEANTVVQILFRDNGAGMSTAQINHIFEPFYTTKDPGKGTGLGLATTHSIIEQQQGEINVTSQLGEGTTFIIHLPILPTASQP